MKIIALSGLARHGKDTTALYLKKFLEEQGKRVLITHYADLLKHICVQFFNWDGEKNEHGRSLLQHVGTDIVRKKRPDYWVDFIIDALDLFKNEWDYVVIGDARFPNEISKLKDHGFDVIHARVTRPNYESQLTQEQQAHPSETALNDYPVDVWITNETIDQLAIEVKLFASHLIFTSNLDDKHKEPRQISIFDGYPYTEGA